jgi:Tol biopolymer transport system component
MTDLDSRFRLADRIEVSDLWPEIRTRQPNEVPHEVPPPPSRRWVTLIVALLVGAAAVAVAVVAFSSARPKTETPGSTKETGVPSSRLVMVLGDPHPGIFSVATNGAGLQPLTSSSHDQDAAPSPDGKKIAFVRHGIYLMNADGTNVAQLTADGSDNNPTWSPDGTTIAFSREIPTSGGDTPNADIFTVPVVGGPVVRITDDPLLELEPAWSPDGTRIAFGGYEQPPGQPPTSVRLYVMRSDGTGITLLGGTDVGDPAWSPDGSQIAFAQELGGLFAIRSDGTNLREVYTPTSSQSFTFSPSWSPDGTQLAFVSGDTISDLRVFIIDADGSGLKQLPIDPSDYMEVSWAAST